MTNTTAIALALVASTLFAGSALAHERQSAVAIGAGARVGSTVNAGLGAVVGGLANVGLNANVGGRGGLLNLQTTARTPLASVGLGAQVGGRGELVSLDAGAFSGGVGR